VALRDEEHIGMDLKGIVHSLKTTDATAADVTPMPELMHGEERAWYGDRAYWSEEDREFARSQGIRYRIIRGRSTASDRRSEREASTRFVS
jgi:IS5 family transposase